MSNPEGPKPFKIVGGTDYNPEPTPTFSEKKSEHFKNISPRLLVELFIEIMKNLPTDYEEKVDRQSVDEAAEKVRFWTIENLYTHLNSSEKWTWPSFTAAVLEEVSKRMNRQDFGPK